MGMRMLIDATHPEETRVVVVKGTRLEEFDYETSTKQVNKGNIYLARVTRVEPSLQAAFVEYGGNRHGFLAFSEIHPDYYQIPIADRQALLAQQAEEEARAAEAEEAELAAEEARAARRAEQAAASDRADSDAGVETVDGDYDTVEEITTEPTVSDAPASEAPVAEAAAAEPAALRAEQEETAAAPAEAPPAETGAVDAPVAEAAAAETPAGEAVETSGQPAYWNVPHAAAPVPTVSAPADDEHHDDHASDAHDESHGDEHHADDHHGDEGHAEDGKGEENGKSDESDEGRARRRRTNVFRRYKIQEVIKRRQIMLVQVVKEERGNKGAALTTYLSLAGRYCVLMPNTARGGGISRKIQSQADRKRLKAITAELDIQDGMGVIVRTAGMERSKPEIKRDFEYLLRSWDSIRERTLESSAPALIYEEAGLIKRSIRDLYSDQIDEVIVEGEEGYRFAHDFMQMLMPNHADNVKQYQDKIPLFTRYQVEQQLDAMFSPTVQLRSGGYIVINPTEALVSIDVNSGKSTREHNIEETAYKTNLEAAEEVARQLRLRDLAGLVVIDFIDMEENRNIRKVEQKLKECLRNDRARIQVGRISGFGLLEMSRQRLRPSLLESSTMPCPHCQGRGYVRSIESTALTVLRAIEEEGIRDRSAEITVAMSAEVALYLLNHKRDRIGDMERRYVMRVILAADPSLVPPDFRIERSKTRQPGEVNRPEAPVKLDPMRPITQESAYASDADEGDAEDADSETETAAEAGGTAGEEGAEGDARRRRRRRRRRGGRDREGREDGREEGVSAGAAAGETEADGEAGPAGDDAADESGDDEAGEQSAEPRDGEAQGENQGEGLDGEGRRRRRGRRGGRRRRGREEGGEGGERTGERQPRAERAPREDRPRRDDSYDAGSAMTPAAIGAMLDGVPDFDFGDDEPVPQRAPASKAIEHEPEALAPFEAPALSAPPPVDQTSTAPSAAPDMPPAAQSPAKPAPAAPVSTGPVFETTVIRPDGNADKPADAPAPKKGWWRR
ncbi:MAG: Rne/Rng family ribonuclease [Ferrovibrio sp.]|uniref:Rne/Rng family ribonuclease n=1 Tax=Ferrovibrio sp. TaxID=1917215 RepID=UPI0026350F7D|nr:Rne/Rng family ribonuclease [Ferrovibrio sp.]MCW0235714.1 Rne/Rng family ribonuclease [Ferrovibrio sp.]